MPLEPKEPDYSLAWVRGCEHIHQEGTDYIKREREKRGWTRDQVYELTDFQIDPNLQGLIEGDYSLGMPYEIDHLITYATLFDTSPGALLDAIYEEKGRELLAEAERDG